MEIKGDIENIKRDIKSIEQLICKTKDIHKKVRLINDLFLLCQTYINLIGEDEILLEHIPISKFQLSKSHEYGARNKKTFYENFIENKEYHREFANEITDELFDIINRFKCYSVKKNDTCDQRKIEILNEFFDIYNPNGKKILNDLLHKNRIYKTKMNIDEREGYTVFIPSKKRSLIVLNQDYQNYTDEMINLVHELGHNIDYNDLKKINNRKIYDYFALSSYSETIPIYYQVEFINYLIDNNLGVVCAKNQFQSLYDIINTEGNSLLYVSSLNDKEILNEEYLNKNDISIDNLDYYEYNKIFNSVDIDHIDKLYDIVNYFYGGLIGIYFLNLRKEDPVKFKYYYKKFLHERTNIFNREQLDNIGFNNETCIKSLYQESKVLKK